MSTSAFARHEAGDDLPAALDSRQAALVELLSAAGGEPVSYGELQEAGIELPASAISGLELAGIPIVRCFLGEARGVGVRLERPYDTRRVVSHTPEAASYSVASPIAGERPRDRLTRVARGVVGRVWAAVAALVAWAFCVGPPAARYVFRWLLSASRAAGERAGRTLQHALSAAVRRVRSTALAVAAWLARAVPPATRAAIEPSHDVAEWLRGSIADALAALRASRRSPIPRAWQAPSTAYPLGPPPDATIPLRPRASRQTRNRCLAFSALAAVSGVMLVLVLSNLGAGDRGSRPLTTHERSRLGVHGAARRARVAQTTSATK